MAIDGDKDAGAATGEAAARSRVDELFASFDRLTPDELGRIGLGGWDDESHEELLDSVDDAAERSGRTALVDEARAKVRDAVLSRYSAGTLHPTWVDLNWGLSQGTVEDRVAIVEMLSDAAAAAVLADVLDPEDYEALSLPAEHLISMAAGMASEGSLGRQMAVPADPELGPSRAGRSGRLLVLALIASVVVGGYSIGAALAWVGPEYTLLALGLIAVATAGLVAAVARR